MRRIAEDALALVSVAEPPVPLDDVVASLCIPIRTANLPQFFTSAIVYEDGLPVMVVNLARPELARRHAIAHMLGHVLLLLDDGTEGFPRKDGDHREADRVAKELLMPAKMLAEQAALWFNDHRYLSRLFGVTEAQMVDRLRELGIIRTQGIRWDY